MNLNKIIPKLIVLTEHEREIPKLGIQTLNQELRVITSRQYSHIPLSYALHYSLLIKNTHYPKRHGSAR
jgi:hypothetical protein